MITVTDLALQRNGRVLHPRLSFTLEKGQIWWVRGPNGTGKSTLLKALLGWLPHPGITHEEGISLAYLGHQPATPGYLTVWQHCQLHPTIAHLDTQRCQAYLDDFGLAASASTRIAQLSAGQKQRLAIIPVLLSDAQVYLLDEPFTALDTGSVQNVKSTLETARQRGISMMVVSHDDLSDWATHTLSLEDTIS